MAGAFASIQIDEICFIRIRINPQLCLIFDPLVSGYRQFTSLISDTGNYYLEVSDYEKFS